MNVAVAEQKLPPMLTQYLDYKARYPECLLFFQVGDFYELFFEDAQIVSKTLNLTLTSRDKSSPTPVPMCGVPIVAVEGYVERLVDAGHAVAIVSQVGQQQGGRGMFTRALERIVTPGIRLLGQHSGAAKVSYVLALSLSADHDFAAAWSDVQTGKVVVREGLSERALSELLGRVSPREVVVPKALLSLGTAPGGVSRETRKHLERYTIRQRIEDLDPRSAARSLSAIKGFASLGIGARKALRLLMSYVDETTVGATVALDEVVVDADESTLQIDAATRLHLELVKNSRDGSEKGTLFEHLNRTVTAGGARLLRQWLVAPLRVVRDIQNRQGIVGALRTQRDLNAEATAALKGGADCERIIARTELRIAGPRELAALRDSLLRIPTLQRVLSRLAEALPENTFLHGLVSQSELRSDVLDLLTGALVEAPPIGSNEGGIFKDGCDSELDRLRSLNSSGRNWLSELEVRERQRSGIPSLKVRYNNVLGFFIEVTRSHVSKVPADYIPRQSTAAAERYVTEEIKNHEAEVLGARDKQVARERELFEALRDSVVPFAADVRRVSAVFSALDVLQALAEVADREGYLCPEVDESKQLFIAAGRHPVLETILRGDFVPNTLHLDDSQRSCVVITGPNMGGKSTFLRQAALIVILAQIGSFVPAKEALIGVVDKIFTRIGASDDMIEGESTFMVEMKEAARILAGATDRSLLLIDEIGRGTATADGLAIARAIVEWIVTTLRCRTLFATHFHELTELEGLYSSIKNISVSSVEQGDDVVFTHEMRDGPASKSYGIEVAKLAGLPDHLIARARELLASSKQSAPKESQLSIFSARAQWSEPADYRQLRRLAERVRTIAVEETTPLQALALLDELRRLGKESA